MSTFSSRLNEQNRCFGRRGSTYYLDNDNPDQNGSLNLSGQQAHHCQSPFLSSRSTHNFLVGLGPQLLRLNPYAAIARRCQSAAKSQKADRSASITIVLTLLSRLTVCVQLRSSHPTFLPHGIVGPKHERLIFEFSDNSATTASGDIPELKSSTALSFVVNG